MIIGPEGVVQGLLVVEMKHIVTLLSIWPLSQLDSETL